MIFKLDKNVFNLKDIKNTEALRKKCIERTIRKTMGHGDSQSDLVIDIDDFNICFIIKKYSMLIRLPDELKDFVKHNNQNVNYFELAHFDSDVLWKNAQQINV